eukprot:TRINITY_DN42249_c0_g1_i1.p1 TRINITY_DN42249_c0_g1~~TRINITY_DN42249_c0_g1_i1.p1  ORF type:complete len:245 (-),score=69.64 TRINITY_DN42249_c0_g1_i1:27-761(-)
MLKLLSRRLVTRSQNLIFQQSAKQCSSAPESKELTAPPNPFEHYDYFGVSKLFTVKTLFDSRMHLGHTVRSLQPQMSPFVFGTRFDMCVIDLDQTALMLRQALNFTAQIAYKGGIVLFVCKQPSLVHMTDRAAQDCGEYSYTRPWKTEIFTATNLTFGQEIRLPDLVVMVHTKDKMQYADHSAIKDCGKVAIPTVGLVDTDCNPNLITFPVPGNDDSQDSVQMFLDLMKQAVLLGKEKRKTDFE